MAEFMSSRLRVDAVQGPGSLWETWTAFEAHLDAGRPPEPVELKPDNGGACVLGERYRLLALDEGQQRSLPSNGKVRSRAQGVFYA